jgi:hypothetical protein
LGNCAGRNFPTSSARRFAPASQNKTLYFNHLPSLLQDWHVTRGDDAAASEDRFPVSLRSALRAAIAEYYTNLIVNQ